MGVEDKKEDGPSPGEEDSVASIFRQISSLSSESTQWPQGVLSKLSDGTNNTTEEARDLPPGEQLSPFLKRSTPVVPSVLSDDLSVKSSDITVSVRAFTPRRQPFYVIQFNKDGNGEVIEQPQVAAISIRKRCRSKDLFPEPRMMKKTVENLLLKDQDDTTKRQRSAGSHLEMFEEFMDALTPSMCAPVINANMGSYLTPWHSSSSIDMHHQPRGCSPKQTTAFHHKSYLSTTMSACRAF